jgi:flagellar biosynthesis/type III secretory pathway protein FliH
MPTEGPRPRRADTEQAPRPRYRAFEPQSFDEGAAALARGPVAREADFRPQFEEERRRQAVFQERPSEASGPETDFASLKFQRENTLLTNAESYAASIREEAQLYVRQLRGEVEGLNAQAEQRYAEAERVKQEAQAEGERLIAEARAQMASIHEQARAEGFEVGKAEGVKQRYEEAAPNLEQLEAVLEEMAQFRRRLAFYTEKDGVRLALLIAKKVLHAELKINKQAIAHLVASALAKLQGTGAFRVWVSQEDHAFMVAARPSLERFLDEEQTLTLRAKPELSPGNVLIETDREVIDLTFQSQFHHLEQQLTQTLAEREAIVTRRRGGGEEPATAAAAANATPQPKSPAKPASPASPRAPASPAPPKGRSDGP